MMPVYNTQSEPIDFRLVRLGALDKGPELRRILAGDRMESRRKEDAPLIIPRTQEASLFDFLVENWRPLVASALVATSWIPGLGAGVVGASLVAAVVLNYLHYTSRVGLDHGLATFALASLTVVVQRAPGVGIIGRGVAFAAPVLMNTVGSGLERTRARVIQMLNDLPDVTKWLLLLLIASAVGVQLKDGSKSVNTTQDGASGDKAEVDRGYLQVLRDRIKARRELNG